MQLKLNNTKRGLKRIKFNYHLITQLLEVDQSNIVTTFKSYLSYRVDKRSHKRNNTQVEETDALFAVHTVLLGQNVSFNIGINNNCKDLQRFQKMPRL